MAIDRTELGAQLNLVGSALHTTYVNGPTFYASACPKALIEIVLTTNNPTSITSFTIKLQGSAVDGTDFDDIQTTEVDTGTAAVEHQYTAPSAGASVRKLLTVDPRLFAGGLQLACKTAGGAGTGTDSAVATVNAG